MTEAARNEVRKYSALTLDEQQVLHNAFPSFGDL